MAKRCPTADLFTSEEKNDERSNVNGVRNSSWRGWLNLHVVNNLLGPIHTERNGKITPVLHRQLTRY